MKSGLSIAAVVGVLATALVIGKTFAQIEPNPYQNTRVEPPVDQAALSPMQRMRDLLEAPATGASPSVPDPNSKEAVEIRRIMHELRHTEENAKKAELTKQLEAAVTKYFDTDLQGRETELAKIEERVKKLRAQLDRRRTAKAEIIQLQLKVLANEAEGLGFSTGSDFHVSPNAPVEVFYNAIPDAGTPPSGPR